MAEHQHASDDGRPHRRVTSHWRWRPEWTPRRTALWWYLTFEEHPLLAETGRGLAEVLRHDPGLDLNPGRWLHLTLREVGFVDDIPDRAVVGCVAATRRSLRDVRLVTVRTDGTGTLPGAVVRWVEPGSEVARLRDAVVGEALPPAAGADQVAPEVVRPHVSIAYARSDLDASDVVALLPQPVEVAVPVARAAGVPLVLAGPVAGIADPEELQRRLDDGSLAGHPDAVYWRDEVAPLVDGDTVRWVGGVGGAEKERLLRTARALLAPNRWAEPGATGVVEALSRGVPVVATPLGVLPSLVEHGVTGWLAADEPALVGALGALDQIDPEACRKAAAPWTPAAMAEQYLELYDRLLEDR